MPLTLLILLSGYQHYTLLAVATDCNPRSSMLFW